jgi:hypothetical protein
MERLRTFEKISTIMIPLMDRLLARWTRAFDERDAIDQNKALAKTYLYASTRRYNLKYFENAQFSNPEDWAAEDETPGWIETFTYGFIKEDLPCYMTSRHRYNKTVTAGFYKYSDDLVERIEFDLATGIPSRLQWVECMNGKKTAFFSLEVGYGGPYSDAVVVLSKEEIVQRLKKDLIVSITQYQYDETGKIVSTQGIDTLPSHGQYTTRDEYTYGPDDTLLAIRRFSGLGQGTDRLIYSRIPENTSAEMIIDKLAAALSVAVVDAIIEDRKKEATRSENPQCIDDPIGLVNLTYSYADSYYPQAGYQLARTIKEDLVEGLFNFCSSVREAHGIDTYHIQDLFAQLEQLMEEGDDDEGDICGADLGRNMLRMTAAILVQTRLHGRLPVSEDFGALAMDTQVEGFDDENIEEILIACGNDASTLSLWKEKGMLQA